MPQTAPAASPNKGRPTVFVVDDNPVGRDSLRFLLESAGLPVETYESGVAFLRQPPVGRIGCVVLDLRMRGMNRLDLEARLAKVAKAKLPVIMISSEIDESSAAQQLKARAFAVVERPFPGRVLLAVVDRALATIDGRGADSSGPAPPARAEA